MGNREKIVLAALFLLVIISGWYTANQIYKDNTNPAAGYGGTYREAIVGQPRFVNPVLATTPADTALVRLVYSSLYAYDENGQLVPELAETLPAISEDQKEYTVRIRADALWHNERNVTADDVVFTIQTIQNPAFKSPLRANWLNTTVEKINDQEVRFKNKNISAPFIHSLTIPLLPQKIWERVGADNFTLSELNLKAIGSGPYQVREINKLPNGDIQKITLESFHKFTLGRPYIERISVSFFNTMDDAAQAYQTNEVSGVSYLAFSQGNSENFPIPEDHSFQIALPEYQALFFNVNNTLLADKYVRRVLGSVVPKQEIIDKLLMGKAKPLSSPILPEQIGYKEINPLVLDLATAGSELSKIGYEINENGVRAKKGVPFEITIATNDSPVNTKTAELISDIWSKLNILVHVQTLPTKDLTENLIRPRSFDVLLFGQRLSADPDPFVFWHSSQVTDPGLNVTGFKNAEVDSLLTEARTTTNIPTRQANYQRFLEILNEETPAVFLNQGVLMYATRDEVKHPDIKGIYDASYRFINIKNWYIKETRVWK